MLPRTLRPAAVTLLLVLVLAVIAVYDASSQAAQQSSSRQGEAARSETTTAKGPHPGIYIFLDSENVDPAQYPVVTGGNMTFQWANIEITDDVFDWSDVDEWLSEQSSLGKAAGIGFSVYDGRCCGGQRTPRWLMWQNENTVVRCDAMNWPIPRYWDPQFLAEYAEYIKMFAHRYDGDPRIAWVEIGVGIFGETKPADNDDKPCLEAAGLTSSKWVEVGKQMIDLFHEAFPHTALLLQYAPFHLSQHERKALSDYAAAKGMGLKHNGLLPDTDASVYPDPNYSLYGTGHYDPMFKHWQNVPIGWETYASQYCDSVVKTLWCVYSGLNKHADYFVLARDLVIDPARRPYLEFAKHYAGVELSETDSVWVALRETEFSWYPQFGNYDFWLYQNDAVPGGRSKAVWNKTDAPEGRYTRRTDRASGNPNLYFDIEDGWLHQNTAPGVQIEVIYLDEGSDTWSLRYDAAGSPDKLAATIQKTNSGQWLTQTFVLNDAYFGNRLPGGGKRAGSDFYLTSNDQDDFFHRIRVFKPGVAPTPTPAPILTATPTATPAPGESAAPLTMLLRNGIDGYNGTTDTWLGGSCNADGDDKGVVPHGNQTVLALRSKGLEQVCNALIRFDLSPIPAGSTIVSARLIFKAAKPPSNTNRLYLNIFDPAIRWEESQATWYYARNGVPWSQPGADGPGDHPSLPTDVSVISGPVPAYGWASAYITPLVQRWFTDPTSNRGVFIRPHTNRVQYDVASSEHPEVGWRPALEIRYYPKDFVVPTATPTRTPTVTPTATFTPTVTLTPTATATPVLGKGDIGGRVYYDINDNATPDPDEPGLVGVQITLYGPDGATQTQLSDTNGDFLFADLPSAPYTIEETTPDGWFPPKPGNILALWVNPEQTHEVYFGHQPQSSVTPIPPKRLWLPLYRRAP